MALTEKQTAARIVKRALTEAGRAIDALDSRSIASVAEKSRLSEGKMEKVKTFAKGFLQPSFNRVNKICAQVDVPYEEDTGEETEELETEEASV